MENQTVSKKNDFMLPASILVAAILIGGAIVWSTGKKAELSEQPNAEEANLEVLAENMLPISADDHIWGDVNAPVKIVTYTDLECPFCQQFHETVKQTMLQFDGKVAVVYRHFPLTQIHPGAQKKAEGAECVAELGGNQRFWDYVARVFQLSETEAVELTALPGIAKGLGVDEAKFNECLASGKYAEKITAQTEDGVNSGGQGTPYSIVISEKGKKFPVPGAYPFESTGPNVPSFKAIVEEALADGN